MSLILSVSVKVGSWNKIKDRIGMTSINIITLCAKLRSVIAPVCLYVCLWGPPYYSQRVFASPLSAFSLTTFLFKV